MQKIKDYLSSSLGVVGFFIYLLIATLIPCYPLIMFEMSWWLFILLAILVQIILPNIPFGIEALWIVGLVGAISGKQDIFAIIYYILFVVIVGSTVFKLLRIFLSNKLG